MALNACVDSCLPQSEKVVGFNSFRAIYNKLAKYNCRVPVNYAESVDDRRRRYDIVRWILACW